MKTSTKHQCICMVLFAILCQAMPTYAEDKGTAIWVEAEGTAIMGESITLEAAQRASLEAARRAAIEKAVGSYVTSSTNVRNFQLAEDLVRVISRGKILEEQVLDRGLKLEGKGELASYRTRIKAKVQRVEGHHQGNFSVQSRLNRNFFENGDEAQIHITPSQDARDVQTFRTLSNTGLIIVVRCPKVTARAWHGLLRAKGWAEKGEDGKSGPSGVTKKLSVSDYDLMSLWRNRRKIYCSASRGAISGPYPAEATLVIRQLNTHLLTKIQHGCQDDFCSALNPNVKLSDHFAAFRNGMSEYLPNFLVCKNFYGLNYLMWPYDEQGQYMIKAAKEYFEKSGNW